jgi:hypothetical protein
MGFVLCCCSKNSEPRATLFELKLGQTKEEVIQILSDINASDISAGIQTDPYPTKEWMWKSQKYDISIETSYQDNKLKRLCIWDWKGRNQSSYHHTMEYFEVSNVTFSQAPQFSYQVMSVHNKGKL